MWIKLGLTLGAIIAPIAIGFVYYFLISPTSVRKNDLHQNQILKVHFDHAGNLSYDDKKGKPSKIPEILKKKLEN